MTSEAQRSVRFAAARLGNGTYRVGAESSLTTQPLIAGLHNESCVDVKNVPQSALVDRLLDGDLEVALIPSIDLWRHSYALAVVPAGCIASAGRSLVTRLFCRCRPDQVQTVWTDTRAGSSLALAEILWAQNYGRRLSVLPLEAQTQDPPEDAEAVLLVGDRVVTDPPLGFDYQIDLAAMWREMTGLPFVFNVWAIVPESPSDCERIYRMLLSSRRYGQRRLVQTATAGAASGWPQDLAVTQLAQLVQYEFTDVHRDSLEELFCLAAEAGIAEAAAPICYYEP